MIEVIPELSKKQHFNVKLSYMNIDNSYKFATDIIIANLTQLNTIYYNQYEDELNNFVDYNSLQLSDLPSLTSVDIYLHHVNAEFISTTYIKIRN